MDFEELKNESPHENIKKNRLTLVFLFSIFFIPVFIAYSAYFTGWFSSATENRGTLLVDKSVLDIEDFEFIRPDGQAISGEEFETIYWWIMPINPEKCSLECIEINTYMLNQTYVGLGKESKRARQLLVLPKGSTINTKAFPVAYSPFTDIGVSPLGKTRSGLGKALPADYIYLVDPLGNIILRYDLAKTKDDAPNISKDLRTDIMRLLRYSRLG
ncbi:hypothetical protein [Aliikangiella maris]|uniref:Uncharacterized protein n=2 Tax=Aliikangiella maris TaxID=3162458 RepID=A0ABV2BXQ4_9GAMM